MARKVERPAFKAPPCHLCPKVPDDAPRKHWDFASEITPTMAKVIFHYRKCIAVNKFPDDPIVEICAVLISEAERHAKELQDMRGEQRMSTLVNNLAKLTVSRR